MKNTFYIYGSLLLIIISLACSSEHKGHNDAEIADLKERLEALENKENYSPGLGSLMLTIQAHHTKLYYAALEENWELSAFLVHELEETFEDVEEHHPEHDGINLSQLVGAMASPAINDLEGAVKEQDTEALKNGYTKLTNACNSCHSVSEHSFVKIQAPEKGDYLNQVFTKDQN